MLSKCRAPIIALLASAAIAAGCVTRKSVTVDVQEAPAAVERIAIREARSIQTQAMNAFDAERAAVYWTDDVTMRRGLGQLVIGKAAYRALVAAPPSRDSAIVYRRQTTDVETSANWPLAFETGVWSAHIGVLTKPAIISGRYSAQWVKRDGKWLIRSEVFVALTCAESGCTNVAER